MFHESGICTSIGFNPECNGEGLLIVLVYCSLNYEVNGISQDGFSTLFLNYGCLILGDLNVSTVH